MSAISVRLPESLHKKLREIAKRDNVSLNQMITVALAEKLSALETEDYLKSRAQRASKKEYERVLANVPDREPEEADGI